MSRPIIEVRNLSKKYRLGEIGARSLREEAERLLAKIGNQKKSAEDEKEFWALQDVSFEVQRGQVLGIVGRNGAGKSTLLKILSRITEPTRGEAVLRGRVASLLEVGTGFHPELSGRENVYLNGAILGMKKREISERFDEIVAFAEVEKFIDTPVKHYSSGMYVRLAFGVAAHLESEILFVDEVLAVGDHLFQQRCLDKMKAIVSSGEKTAFLVSHNMSSLMQVCSHAILLSQGRLLKEGEVGEVIREYSGQARTGGIAFRYLTQKIKCDQIRIEGKDPDDELAVDPDDEIEIKFDVQVAEPCKASPYIFLKSQYGQTLGIFSPGHDQLQEVLSVGTHHLMVKIILPRLNTGKYELVLGMANAGVEDYFITDPGIILTVAGWVEAGRFSFPSGVCNGHINLEGLWRCEKEG